MIEQTLFELGQEFSQRLLGLRRPGSPGFRLLVLSATPRILVHHQES